MAGPTIRPRMMTSGQWVAATQTIVSRVGAYIRSRIANQTLNAMSGTATVSSAPLFSIGLHRVYYAGSRQPSAISHQPSAISRPVSRRPARRPTLTHSPEVTGSAAPRAPNPLLADGSHTRTLDGPCSLSSEEPFDASTGARFAAGRCRAGQ